MYSRLLLCSATIFNLSYSTSFSNIQVQRQIPITVLSGFLGSGKTSLLEKLLNNNEGLRIAVIINDVASVNIDSKLISAKSGAAGLVELQNGCACCSLSEELLGSVSELVTLNDMRGDSEGFHHIVVELSGVADPKSVRAKFQEAVLYDMPLMERVRLDTMVTVIDCSVFLDHLKTSKSLSPEEAPELFFVDGKPSMPTEQWQNDFSPKLLEALMAGDKAYNNIAMVDQESSVVDLLVSQTEIADIVLLNKIDLADRYTVENIESIVTALNPRATLLQSKYGNVQFTKILGAANGLGVVQAGLVDDHKDAVAAATANQRSNLQSDKILESTHMQTHEHLHDHTLECTEPDCTDTSHSHDYDYGHDHQCNNPECKDPSHSRHNRNKLESSQNHVHDHHCDDPDCTDVSHTHNYVHGNLGSFVYRARRPFHPRRLLSFLHHMPITRGLEPLQEDMGIAKSEKDDLTLSELSCKAMKRVMRSKGFVWCADSNVAALYWSHAGTSIELTVLGRWWATLPRANWPAEAINTILGDFDNPQHDDTNAECLTVGDRRQELVFIGLGLGDQALQRDLSIALDQCILDNEEWVYFREKRFDDVSLRARFPSPIHHKILNY